MTLQQRLSKSNMFISLMLGEITAQNKNGNMNSYIGMLTEVKKTLQEAHEYVELNAFSKEALDAIVKFEETKE